MAEVKILSKFSGLSPDEVEATFNQGGATEDDVLDYAASEDFRANGFYGMDVENVQHSFNRGFITEDQVVDYSDANVSPVGFYSKDLGLRAPAHGINMAMKNFGKYVLDAALNLPAQLTNVGITGAEALARKSGIMGEDEHIQRFGWTKVFEVDQVIATPKTGGGELVSELSEFITGFVPSLKAVQATRFVSEIAMSSPKVVALTQRFPSLGKVLPGAIEGAIAGSMPDVLNDPFEGGVSDALNELGVLPEYLEFMTTDKDNPDAVERLKKVLEGVAMGAVGDSLFWMVRAIKARKVAKYAGDMGKVAEDVRLRHPDTDPAALEHSTPFNEPISRFREVDSTAEGAMREDFDQAAPAAGPAPASKQFDAPWVEEAAEDAGADVVEEAAEDVIEYVPLVPAKVPDGLMKSTPEYRGAQLEFTSEVDKAIYYAGAKQPSKARDQYTKWLKEQGLSDKEIQAYYKDIRSYVKDNYGDGEFVSVPDMEVKVARKTQGAPKAPAATTRKAVEAPTQPAPELTREQIRSMDPHLLTPSQYSTRHDAHRVPTSDELLEDASRLSFDGTPVGKLNELAEKLNIPPGQNRQGVVAAIRGRLMLRKLLENPENLTRLTPDARRDLYKEVTGQSMPRGPASTPTRQAADMLIAVEKMLRDAAPMFAGAKHAGFVQKAARQGRDIPAAVLEAYRDTEWAKAYATKKGIQLGQKGKAAAPVTPRTKPAAVDRRGAMEAYNRARTRLGYVNIEIAELQRESGIPLDELKAFLIEESRAGRAVLSLGDASVSSAEAREAAVELLGKKNLLVRLDDPEAPVRAPADDPEAVRLSQEEVKRAEPRPTPEPAREAEAATAKEAEAATAVGQRATPATAQTVEESAQATRILKKAGDVTDIEDALLRDTNFLGRVEEGSSGGALELVKRIYMESGEVMESLRKTGSGTFKNIEAQSRQIFKQLADLTGKNENFTTQHFMGAARQIYSEMSQKAAQAHFVNQFFVTYTDAVAKLADEAIDAGTGTFEKQLKAYMHIKQLQELQALVFGIRAEGGRLLNSYNMKFQKGKFDILSIPKESLSELERAKKEDILEAIKTFREAKNTKERMLRARAIGKNPLMRGILELAQANMLWNPATHAANILGNTINLGYKTVTRTLGLSIQALTQADLRYIQAAGAMWTGIGEGFVKAMRFTDMTEVIRGRKTLAESDVGNMWKSMWSGEGTLDAIAKEDLTQANSILVEAMAGTGWGKSLGHLLTAPFHALVGMDETFKAMAYHGRLREEAVEAALAASPKAGWSQIWGQAQILAKDPSPDLHYRALKYAREVTFQEELGATAQKINSVLMDTNTGIAIKMMAMPFYKTPINIMRQAVKNTPLGLLSREVRESLLDAGSVRQKDMIVRMLGGSAACFAFLQAYDGGMITGRRPKEAAEDWKNAGVQEYSFKFGDRWIPYDRFEPFGMIMGMMANVGLAIQHLDAYRTVDPTGDRLIEGEKLFSAVILGLTDATLNKTYMTSMRELIQLGTDPERMNPEKWLARQSEKFLTATSAVNYWSERQDDYVREINEMADGIIKYNDRTKLLPARHSVYGTKVPLDPRWGGVFKQKFESDDPVMWELLNNGAHVRPMSNRISVSGVEQKLTPQQLDEVEAIVETLPVQEILTSIVESPGYQQIQDAKTKADMLRGVISQARSTAKNMWVGGNKEIMGSVSAQLQYRAGAIAGYYTNPDPVARMNNWAEFNKDLQPE